MAKLRLTPKHKADNVIKLSTLSKAQKWKTRFMISLILNIGLLSYLIYKINK